MSLRKDGKLNVFVLVGVACALSLSACGGGSGSSGETASKDGKGGEPSAEFAGNGPNGELASVGKESSAAEREAASAVVEESFKARAAADWEGQCETLAAAQVKPLEDSPRKGAAGKDCGAALEAIAKRSPKGVLKNPMAEPLTAMRVNGSYAFAFFHGVDGKNYVIPMVKEGGEWKVGALVPEEVF
ncbi:MAG TPA: hypothetical protein VMS11_02135 [Solirubrobacterales bacterium]|nr:hypothetical protein [Solirubrobacterales bacterium]